MRLPSVWGNEVPFIAHWISLVRAGEDIELYTFNGHAKHKFFVTLPEAVEAILKCRTVDESIHVPRARVVDCSTIAEVLSEGTKSHVITSERDGIWHEELDAGYSSADISPLDEHETRELLHEVFGWTPP